MRNFTIVEGYSSSLSLRETQKAIKYVKDTFQKELKAALGLERISAPLFVEKGSGINDDLNGTERKVSFDLKETGQEAEVVQSLAKWKRMALGRYNIAPGQGLYTDMNAIRRDEELDNIHSLYVDQWDWEKVISAEQRNEAYLEQTVRIIYRCLVYLGDYVNDHYPELDIKLPDKIKFIDSQELEDWYPDKTSKEREKLAAEEYGAIFIKRIGGKLRSGKPHDGRAPDYDDWELNGDIILWNEVLEDQFEISSMGIRVDAEAMDRQLTLAGCEDRRQLRFHQSVLNDQLPLTIGGGIGQSRLCMYFLRKAHIGEVQVSLWPEDVTKEALSNLKQCTSCDYDTKTAFLICYDKELSWKRPFDGADSGQTDCSIIATHMMLSAASIGVGTTWVMWFDPAAVRTEFALADELVPAAILVMGHAAPDAAPSPMHAQSRARAELIR